MEGSRKKGLQGLTHTYKLTLDRSALKSTIRAQVLAIYGCQMLLLGFI
jgi:hypothetical protein